MERKKTKYEENRFSTTDLKLNVQNFQRPCIHLTIYDLLLTPDVKGLNQRTKLTLEIFNSLKLSTMFFPVILFECCRSNVSVTFK